MTIEYVMVMHDSSRSTKFMSEDYCKDLMEQLAAAQSQEICTVAHSAEVMEFCPYCKIDRLRGLLREIREVAPDFGMLTDRIDAALAGTEIQPPQFDEDGIRTDDEPPEPCLQIVRDYAKARDAIIADRTDVQPTAVRCEICDGTTRVTTRPLMGRGSVCFPCFAIWYETGLRDSDSIRAQRLADNQGEKP